MSDTPKDPSPINDRTAFDAVVLERARLYDDMSLVFLLSTVGAFMNGQFMIADSQIHFAVDLYYRGVINHRRMVDSPGAHPLLDRLEQHLDKMLGVDSHSGHRLSSVTPFTLGTAARAVLLENIFLAFLDAHGDGSTAQKIKWNQILTDLLSILEDRQIVRILGRMEALCGFKTSLTGMPLDQVHHLVYHIVWANCIEGRLSVSPERHGELALIRDRAHALTPQIQFTPSAREFCRAAAQFLDEVKDPRPPLLDTLSDIQKVDVLRIFQKHLTVPFIPAYLFQNLDPIHPEDPFKNAGDIQFQGVNQPVMPSDKPINPIPFLGDAAKSLLLCVEALYSTCSVPQQNWPQSPETKLLNLFVLQRTQGRPATAEDIFSGLKDVARLEFLTGAAPPLACNHDRETEGSELIYRLKRTIYRYAQRFPHLPLKM